MALYPSRRGAVVWRVVWPAPAVSVVLVFRFVSLSLISGIGCGLSGAGVALSFFLSLFLFLCAIPELGGVADRGKDKPLSAWPRGLLCCCVSVSCGNLALILLSVCRPVSRRTYLSPNQ